MSIQKQLLEDILSSYNIISENKKLIREASQFVKLADTNYSNVLHDEDGTQNDSVNKALLDDIQKAAKSVDIVATITTAKTGHNQNVKDSNRISRHMNGTGVDLAILNGIGSGGANGPKNGSTEFRELGNKLKDALVSMGYIWNTESGNDKAVMWQTTTGGNHYSHLHVSNRTGVSDIEPTTSSQTSTTNSASTTNNTSTTSDSDSSGGGAGGFAKSLGRKILGAIGIKESVDLNKFGNDIKLKGEKLFIPKNSNTKIKTPVSGKITDIISSHSCINQITVEFKNDTHVNYLEYCGITNPDVKVGDRVSSGDLLGTTNSNVMVSFYSERRKKQPIKDLEVKQEKKSSGLSTIFTKKSETNKTKNRDDDNYPSHSRHDSEYAKLLVKGYRDLKKGSNPKKIEENINRIKGLL